MVNSLTAANAYQNQLKLMQNAPSAAPEETTGPSFSQMVESALDDAAGAGQKSEALQVASMTGGKVDLSDLVTAVANAELSLSTVVAVRDRVINAYQDIIKMSI